MAECAIQGSAVPTVWWHPYELVHLFELPNQGKGTCKMIMTNPRPTYAALPARSTMTQRIIPGRFVILEYRGNDVNLICELSNRGDRLNNLLKRGIPMDDARGLFYAMDS